MQPVPHQRSLCFEGTPALPEAEMNDFGVLKGWALVREWWPDRYRRAFAMLVVRRLGGEYCYSTAMQIGSCYSGGPSSFKWNRFFDFSLCVDSGMASIGQQIDKAVLREDFDKPVAAVLRLQRAFADGEFEERLLEFVP